jgi:predicted nucleic acid-binding protein
VTLVVDASVAAKWFIQEDGRDEALRLLDATERHAPDLILAEVANAAWKKALRGEVTSDHARLIGRTLGHYFDVLHPCDVLIERAVAMALELRHPIYDCLYLACAESVAAPLVTADRRLLRAIRGRGLATLVVHVEDLKGVP